MSYRTTSSNYIPTVSDLLKKQDAQNTRAAAAKERGFRLGKFQLEYEIAGAKETSVISAYSQDDAIANLKQQFGMNGIIPYNINVKVIDSGNIYV